MARAARFTPRSAAPLRADLKNLANLQAVYYNDHYSYSTSEADLEFDGTKGVSFVVAEATNLGWSASASHAALPTESCAI
jgi:hypothetical protein